MKYAYLGEYGRIRLNTVEIRAAAQTRVFKHGVYYKGPSVED